MTVSSRRTTDRPCELFNSGRTMNTTAMAAIAPNITARRRGQIREIAPMLTTSRLPSPLSSPPLAWAMTTRATMSALAWPTLWPSSDGQRWVTAKSLRAPKTK